MEEGVLLELGSEKPGQHQLQWRVLQYTILITTFMLSSSVSCPSEQDGRDLYNVVVSNILNLGQSYSHTLFLSFTHMERYPLMHVVQLLAGCVVHRVDKATTDGGWAQCIHVKMVLVNGVAEAAGKQGARGRLI